MEWVRCWAIDLCAHGMGFSWLCPSCVLNEVHEPRYSLNLWYTFVVYICLHGVCSCNPNILIDIYTFVFAYHGFLWVWYNLIQFDTSSVLEYVLTPAKTQRSTGSTGSTGSTVSQGTGALPTARRAAHGESSSVSKRVEIYKIISYLWFQRSQNRFETDLK